MYAPRHSSVDYPHPAIKFRTRRTITNNCTRRCFYYFDVDIVRTGSSVNVWYGRHIRTLLVWPRSSCRIFKIELRIRSRNPCITPVFFGRRYCVHVIAREDVRDTRNRDCFCRVHLRTPSERRGGKPNGCDHCEKLKCFCHAAGHPFTVPNCLAPRGVARKIFFRGVPGVPGTGVPGTQGFRGHNT